MDVSEQNPPDRGVRELLCPLVSTRKPDRIEPGCSRRHGGMVECHECRYRRLVDERFHQRYPVTRIDAPIHMTGPRCIQEHDAPGTELDTPGHEGFTEKPAHGSLIIMIAGQNVPGKSGPGQQACQSPITVQSAVMGQVPRHEETVRNLLHLRQRRTDPGQAGLRPDPGLEPAVRVGRQVGVGNLDQMETPRLRPVPASGHIQIWHLGHPGFLALSPRGFYPIRDPAKAKAVPNRFMLGRPTGAFIMPTDLVPSADEIAVHWREEPRIDPPTDFSRQAQVRDRSLQEALDPSHGPEAFRAYADLLTWDRPYDRVLDASQPPFYRWFPGGQLNASVNAIDRHLPDAADRIAYHFVPEDESAPVEHVSYAELSRRVNRLARLLQDRFALVAGDRVTLYLPMVPELPVAMLACARLGVIHSVVFSGFSGKAAGDRIVDSNSRLLITMDGYSRGGQWVDLKAKADQAVVDCRSRNHRLEGLLVFERTPHHYRSESPIRTPGEFILTDLLEGISQDFCKPVSRESNDGLFIMYSSGTTGRPKGCFHGTGGYLSWVAATTRYVLDLKPQDIYWCMADIGWITGHSYIVYGPLVLGATSVLYEGLPHWPDAARPWRISEHLGVTILHTSPTAIRALRRLDPDLPQRYATAFRLLCTVGEPIEPETWHWYHETVGHRRAVIVDTYWQTETGGHLLATLPGLDAMKPGSAGPPLPGITAAIYDETGRKLPPGSGRAGLLGIEHPWPGLMLGIWNDPDRFRKTYFDPLQKGAGSDRWIYCTHDAATWSADGYFRILGRTDDVINVAGHRLGSKEMESAALSVAGVAEAAVVPYPDPVKGAVPLLFISAQAIVSHANDLVPAVAQAVVEAIGPIARPHAVILVSDLPKTRSGKIMRRILRAVARGEEAGDVTTLANPESVSQVRDAVGKSLAAHPTPTSDERS